MTTAITDIEAEVHAALCTVDDPEYPGVSIVELGLLERITVADGGRVEIGLVPTFSGCPALSVIARDVEAAVAALASVESVEVRWLNTPLWTVERISAEASAALADQFTVAVRIGRGPALCPRCGSPTIEQSVFGPSRCRSVHRCPDCVETVEVMRS